MLLSMLSFYFDLIATALFVQAVWPFTDKIWYLSIWIPAYHGTTAVYTWGSWVKKVLKKQLTLAKDFQFWQR